MDKLSPKSQVIVIGWLLVGFAVRVTLSLQTKYVNPQLNRVVFKPGYLQLPFPS
jgi:hypothetical protein